MMDPLRAHRHWIAPLLLALSWLVAGPVHSAAGDTVLLLEIDGARHRTVAELYRRGRLPGLRRLARDKGGRFLRTITTFPSATAPSLPELLVGRYSDRCQADLLRRVQGFDRTTGRIDRYEFERKAWDTRDVDLFDLVARSGRRSFSYFEGEFRNASVNDFNPLGYRIEFATGYARLPTINYDRQVMSAVLRDLKNEKPPPALVFIGLGAADIAGHARGPEHPDYAKAIVENDAQLLRLIAVLEATPHPKGGSVYQHSAFFVFGDHGMAPTREHLSIGRSLNQAGIITGDGADLGAMLQASLLKDWYQNVDAVVLGIGSNVAELQVRRRTPRGQRRPWVERPALAELRDMPVSRGRGGGSVDLVSYLVGHVGMEMVMVAEGPGRVQVFSPGGGEALVVREGPPEAPRRFAYQVRRTDARGRDPLGYLQEPAARALITPAHAAQLAFHSTRAWFDATAHCAQPLGPPLIPKAFDPHPTAPDILLVARPDFGFLPVVKGDHGSLQIESSVSFLLAAAPGLEPGLRDGDTVRLIDVHAEVRRYLELPEDPASDSWGLRPAARAGAKTQQQPKKQAP